MVILCSSYKIQDMQFSKTSLKKVKYIKETENCVDSKSLNAKSIYQNFKAEKLILTMNAQKFYKFNPHFSIFKGFLS